ncbi:flagellin lysine-N-methylase [Tepidibacter sp. Z1-5]|uniref:flagellin lysine-N-methylase n=1 Tax=Tepidibacter sp. Z1-5 TaxID=3134138 RepID=UPI0030BE338B
MIRKMTLKPHNIRNFSCIGPECEEHCCYGWGISIDKKTYEKYKSVKQADLKDLMKKNIKRSGDKKNKQNYAFIKKDESKLCPFLNEERLCNIHKQLGEEYLSNTCRTYPRNYNIVDYDLEISLLLSCPEAARCILLNENKMEFDKEEDVISLQTYAGTAIYPMDLAQEKDSIEKYFWNLRIFTIEVLQNREYSLWERLIILGLFYEKVQKYLEEDNIGEIINLIDYYKELLSKMMIKDSLQTITPNYIVQIRLMKTISEFREKLPIISESYKECINEFVEGIKYREDIDIEEVIKNYNEGVELYYKPYVKDYEYIFENYLVHYVFTNLFPLNNNNNIFEKYCMMVIHYSLIKMYLIGMGNYHKKINNEIVIKLIYSFTKEMDHNNELLEIISNVLKKNNYFTMGYMAILIKN